MLKIFENQKIDQESLNLILYANHNIFGIRGDLNNTLILEPSNVRHSFIDKAQMHDLPEVHKMSMNPNYWKKTTVPGMRELVKANKGRQFY